MNFIGIVFLSMAAGIVSGAVSPFVHPLIGTVGEGNTFVGACRPFGFVQAGPDSGTDSWHHCSGYTRSDAVIHGFSQDHFNGTGCTELGDVLLMPYAGDAATNTFVTSRYRPEAQIAEPGYYAVTLDDFNVRAEITCTPRVAYYRFTYADGRTPQLMVDLQHALFDSWRDWGRCNRQTVVVACDVANTDAQTLSGHLSTRHWFRREVFFAVRFDRAPTRSEHAFNHPGDSAPRFLLTFGKGPLLVKVALSTVSAAAARANLEAEAPGWDFDAVRKAAAADWEQMLGRFQVEGTDDQKVNFYTAAYHLFIQPNDIADVGGTYRGPEDRIGNVGAGKPFYSTLSLWDTFRAAHPLYTIVAPERVDDFVRTMLLHFKSARYLPVWTGWGQEGDDMIANHAIPVIVDAYLKGFRGFDSGEAFFAVKQSLLRPHAKNDRHATSDWQVYDRFGYLPFDLIQYESVSRTLEYAYDDGCAAKFAAALGKQEDEAFFRKRSRRWKNLFDPSLKLVRGKDSKGAWREPFDPLAYGRSTPWGGDYTEANAWQYTWHVMQDIPGLVAAMGGPEAFGKQLDQLFSIPHQAKHGNIHDVSGLIGQYAHGNEPSHHIAYLYHWAGRPERTQELVRQICREQYRDAPDGLTGNDDCGQMSAWYLFSCLGFYPVDPCGGDYVLGAPQVPKVVVKVGGGKAFTIIARNFSEKNLYVKSVKLNGRPLAGGMLRHADVVAGGTLEFEMSSPF